MVKNDVEYFEDMIFVLCDRSTFGICKSDLCLWKVYAETAGPFGSTVFFNQTWSTQSISINNGWVFDENYKLCEDWTCAWLWDILYFKISGGQKSEVGMKKNSMTEHPADAWAGDPSTVSTKVEANAILPLRDYEVNAPTAFGKQERLIISEKSPKSAYLFHRIFFIFVVHLVFILHFDLSLCADSGINPASFSLFFFILILEKLESSIFQKIPKNSCRHP